MRVTLPRPWSVILYLASLYVAGFGVWAAIYMASQVVLEGAIYSGGGPRKAMDMVDATALALLIAAWIVVGFGYLDQIAKSEAS